MSSYRFIHPLVLTLVVLVTALAWLPVAAQSTVGAASADNVQGSSPSVIQSLKNWVTDAGEPDLLPLEKAFKASLEAKDANTLVARFEPATGYYLYRDKLEFKVLTPDSVNVAGIALPSGKMKADPTFGHVEVYRVPFEAVVTLDRSDDKAVDGTVRYRYQGCSDHGVCYPPVEKTVSLTFLGRTAGASQTSDTGAGDISGVAGSQTPGWLDPDRSTALLQDASLGWVIAAFFGFGLLLSLTPCVWPMFPILSSIVAGQGASGNRSRSFWLSVFYVLGMAATYASVGVAAGLTGTLLSSALQMPWVLVLMALLFVAFAFSMFGAYELQLPSFLQARIANASHRMNGRASAGVFGMGALSAVIVGPCVAAPLAGALLYIGQTQDYVLGGTALFALALGKGMPLVLVGTALGTYLPRSGPWMKGVKVFLGVLLLAGALWMVSPILPLSAIMALAGFLLVGYAMYLRAFDMLPAEAGTSARTAKGFGLLALIAGAIYLVGAASGGTDFLRPLSGITGAPAGRAETAPLPFVRIASVAEFESRLKEANGRYVMLDFYADWCVSCKEMEYFTFSDPAVRARLRDVVLLQADVTKNNEDDKQLLARFGLFGPPGIFFFDPAGNEVKGSKIVGFMNALQFSQHLKKVMVGG